MFLLTFLLGSCETTQVATVQTPPPSPGPSPQAVAPSPPEPAPQTLEVSEEMYQTTMADIQALVADLNRIIRARNYNQWVAYLSESRLAQISSAAFLEETTNDLHRRNQMMAQAMGRNPNQVERVVLRSPRDYFDHVVVPSRQNDRVDDISFVTDRRVIAYTVDNRGVRLILYDLEMINNRWLIVN
ncbi:MAG: hypothetical protein FWH12_07720 [Treponema sp.]|nr:hypothetical protein [Treponema sp.]